MIEPICDNQNVRPLPSRGGGGAYSPSRERGELTGRDSSREKGDGLKVCQLKRISHLPPGVPTLPWSVKSWGPRSYCPPARLRRLHCTVLACPDIVFPAFVTLNVGHCNLLQLSGSQGTVISDLLALLSKVKQRGPDKSLFVTRDGKRRAFV